MPGMNILFKLPADIRAICPRHPEVNQYQIRCFFRNAVYVFCMGRCVHLVSFTFQYHPYGIKDILIIIQNKNSFSCHWVYAFCPARPAEDTEFVFSGTHSFNITLCFSITLLCVCVEDNKHMRYMVHPKRRLIILSLLQVPYYPAQ